MKGFGGKYIFKKREDLGVFPGTKLNEYTLYV